MPTETETAAKYLTPKEAAALKGVTLATIYKAIERGTLPKHTVLDRVALLASDVESYSPGSYGGVTREKVLRGPGRPRKSEVAK